MATAPDTTPAIAYLRTSSAANVGDEKDSEHRQRRAIDRFCTAAGYRVISQYYDAAVSGADHIDTRPGFAAMLEHIARNGVATIIVETANRFARDLMVQEVGYEKLKGRGITLIAADSPSAFLDDGPTSRLIRQVLGAIAEFDKAMTVAKLRGARERIRAAKGRCEGRKPFAATHSDVVALAKRLRTKPLSLRQIGAELAAVGHLNERGRPYSATSVQRMLEG